MNSCSAVNEIKIKLQTKTKSLTSNKLFVNLYALKLAVDELSKNSTIGDFMTAPLQECQGSNFDCLVDAYWKVKTQNIMNRFYKFKCWIVLHKIPPLMDFKETNKRNHIILVQPSTYTHLKVEIS